MKNVIMITMILLASTFSVIGQEQNTVSDLLRQMSEEVITLTETGASPTVINGVIATYKEAIKNLQEFERQAQIAEQQTEPEVTQVIEVIEKPAPEPVVITQLTPTPERRVNMAQENRRSIGTTSAFRRNRQENTLEVSRSRWNQEVSQERDILDITVSEAVVERRFGNSNRTSTYSKEVPGYIQFLISDYRGQFETRNTSTHAFYSIIEVDSQGRQIPGSMIKEGQIRPNEIKWINLEANARYVVSITYQGKTGRKNILPMADNVVGEMDSKEFYWYSNLNVYDIEKFRRTQTSEVWAQ